MKKLMNLFATNSLRNQFITICLLLLAVPSLIIGTMGYYQAKTQLESSGKIRLMNSVRMIIQTIDVLDQEVKKGNLSLGEAQERVKISMLGPKDSEGKRPINQSINLGANGYPFVMDDKGVLLAHPSKEGTDFWNIEDPNGTKIGKVIVEAALKGDGYSYYAWALPSNPDQIAPKVTYSEKDPHWGWVIGAGTYLEDFNQGANHILNILLITLGISLIAGALIIVVFSRKTITPIIRIADEAKRIADGDLTGEEIRIDRKDEVGKLAHDFHIMKGNLRVLITQVQTISEQLTGSSEELAAGAGHTSKATEQITAAIQEVASGAEHQTRGAGECAQSLEEISFGIQRIAENSSVVSSTAIDTRKQAEHGGKTVDKTVQQMHSIHKTVQESDTVIKVLYERSYEIAKILDVITGISSQTNLLALNAAIEAARAGEHGKGFAVVAGEVRKLAEQSAQSAQQIAQLIKEIQVDTQRSVGVMDQVKQEVQSGLTLAGETEQNFRNILYSMKEITDQVQDVSATAQQMSAGAEQVSAATSIIVQVAKETALGTQHVASASEEQLASMEEITSAASSLAHMAEELEGMIRKFRL